MKQTPETASLEYFNKNSKYRPQLEEAIRTAFEAGAEWKERQRKRAAKYLKLNAGVWYLDDVKANGIRKDESDPKILFDETGEDVPIIDIDTGQIINWPKGIAANIHYKICDNGTHCLFDDEKNEESQYLHFVSILLEWNRF